MKFIDIAWHILKKLQLWIVFGISRIVIISASSFPHIIMTGLSISDYENEMAFFEMQGERRAKKHFRKRLINDDIEPLRCVEQNKVPRQVQPQHLCFKIFTYLLLKDHFLTKPYTNAFH